MLRSIPTGLTVCVEDGVNRDDAERIYRGTQIQTGLDRSRTRTTIEKAYLYTLYTLLTKLEQSPEVQRLVDMISTVSSTNNIIWHCQQRATFICRLYGDDTTSDLTVLRNRPLQTLVEACKRLEPE